MVFLSFPCLLWDGVLSWVLLFVFTLGFSEGFVLRRFSLSAAGSGDGFVCFTARPVVSGVVTAYQTIVA